jgi:ubiquinone/menaquinone biosynthesis methyltransferase
MFLMPASLITNKAAVPKAFNRIAARYDLATGLSHGYREDLERSAALLQLSGDEMVLDLCCGTGKSSAALLPYISTGTLTCVDNSEEMLVEAGKKFKSPIATGKVCLSLQDAMQLNFPDNTFDAIFMAYGLRNMPDYGRHVQGLFRILKPGGKLVIHDYALADTWYARPMWAMLGYGFIVPFCTLLTGSSRIFTYLVQSVLKFLRPAEIQALLESKGLEQVSIHHHANWRRPILHSFLAVKPVGKQ